MVGGSCLASINAQGTIEVSSIVAELFERVLYVDDYLVRQQIAIGINRPVIFVTLIVGIVSPRRVPISRVLIIVSASYQYDYDVVLFPPIAVMPFMVVAALGVRVIVIIVVGCFSTPNVVINRVTIPRTDNGWFVIPRIVIGWFQMAGIVADSFVTARIVICCCGLCWLNPRFRKRPRHCHLSSRELLRRCGLTWRYLLRV